MLERMAIWAKKGTKMKTSYVLFAAMTAMAIPTLSAAETYFSCSQTVIEGSTISLGTITAEADGMVELFDYHGGAAGEKLGEASLTAGANSDVRITGSTPIRDDVIAIVKVNGAPVAEKVFDVCDR